ncbi:hypothetical protein EU538_13125, partial [Candidatus Thorarchaeota archaeon]
MTNGREDNISPKDLREQWNLYQEIAAQGFGLTVRDVSEPDDYRRYSEDAAYDSGLNIATVFVEKALPEVADSRPLKELLAEGLTKIAELRSRGEATQGGSSPFAVAFRIAGESGLHFLRHEILELGSLPDVSREDASYLLFSALATLTPALDEDEIWLTDRLITKQDATLTDISENLEFTVKWVSKKTNELLNRCILTLERDVAPYRLDVRTILLLVERPTKEVRESIAPALVDWDYYVGHDRILTGQWSEIIELQLPSCLRNIQSLAKVRRALAHAGISTRLVDIGAYGVHHCLDFYSPSDAEWAIPWDLMRIDLDRIRDDNLGQAVPAVHEPLQPTKSVITDLDLQIVNLYNQGISTISQIREALHRGQHTVA